MMIKIIGGIVTIGAASAIGFYFSSIVKTRLENLKMLKKHMITLRGDIQYGNTPLPEAITALGMRTSDCFKAFFENVGAELYQLEGNTLFSIWKKGVETNLKETALETKDKENLKRLGENLGYLDKEMQINNINLYLTQLDIEIEELGRTAKEKIKIYNLLGIMGGIFITIVMI